MAFVRDLRVALHSLGRTPGLAVAVILTLALGIGANSAIFTLVRGVLLKPLVNRDEDRLIYIRQSAPGLKAEDTAFSVPEIQDLHANVKTLSAFGDFSIIGFTMVGLGEPREVNAGVVGGSYFDVMGLHPVLGRLIGPQDDGPNAAGAMVLTYRFWAAAFKKDASVIGKTVRLGGGFGDRTATVIGVLEPCVPYPQDTEIIANVVTSPHHLSATMVTGRIHRMTEIFGRLAPGATLEQARAELRSVYNAMKKDHPEAYPANADYQIDAKMFRDQITSGARTILLVLLVASALVFIIACSNVANLVLARTVRREGELAVRSALGASTGALRRMLLAESIVLCGAGALLGVLSARPMVAVLARYASRFSVRALDLKLDSSLLWVGAGLAVVASVILAFVPHLPSAVSSGGLNLSSGSVRVTSATSRRQRVFAVTQIAASFVLLVGASVLITTLMELQRTQTGLDTRHVLAIDVPPMSYGKTPQQVVAFYRESMRRIDALPGVNKTAFGMLVPWRDGNGAIGLEFSGDGHVSHPGEDPRAQIRVISPGFFAALGAPIVAGRDFNELDGRAGDPVAIISESLRRRMFPNGDAINHHVYWTDPVIKFVPGISTVPHRIIGVTADIDDIHMIPEPTVTIYTPFEEGPLFGGRLFVHTSADPYSVVKPVTRVIREMSSEQPVEHAATLEDVRAEVLTPERLNSVVFGVFAAVALAIAVIGVAGVLVFSVSARTREFGIRLALGSKPRDLLRGVVAEGALMAASGILAGAAFGFVLARFAGKYLFEIQMPGALPISLSAFVLMMVAVVASMLPAIRAARVNVMEALRTE
jgi:putative ABC transport system permease protein